MNKIREKSKIEKKVTIYGNDWTMKEFSEIKKWLNYKGIEGVFTLGVDSNLCDYLWYYD